jgi:hypothetical protein
LITYAGAGFAIYAMYSIAEKFGLIKSSEQQAQDTNLQNLQTGGNTVFGSFWSPSFWSEVAKKYGTATIIGTNVANKLSDDLWDATGIFNDDEQAIYGVFRQLQYLSQISFLAQVFYAKHGQDLYGYLKNHLNDDEMNQIAIIVSKFPITSKAK